MRYFLIIYTRNICQVKTISIKFATSCELVPSCPWFWEMWGSCPDNAAVVQKEFFGEY